MPRPHLEFIQTQTVPWTSLGADSPRPGARLKTLSTDPESKACTTIISYPRGWSAAEPQYLTSDEELYVLDGSMSVNSTHCHAGDYAYLPAGYPRTEMGSSSGGAVLTFFKGAPDVVAGDAPQGTYDATRLIERLRSTEMEWQSATESRVAGSGVGLKVLRLDPDNGERTWILKVDLEGSRPFEINGVERHPCVEETFLLEGDMSMPMGAMHTGAYFWRPPNIDHGPMGSRKGFFAFFRSKEGRFETQWSKATGPIDWDAPFEPTVPDDMRQYVSSDYERSQPY